MEIKVKKEDVITALKNCYDPEIPVNIYDLGLIYRIEIKIRKVKIVMSLTSPFCPVTDMLIEDIKNKVKENSGAEDIDLEITFDPPWNQSMMSEEAKARLGL
jgi:FeS assembly SUF system protein